MDQWVWFQTCPCRLSYHRLCLPIDYGNGIFTVFLEKSAKHEKINVHLQMGLPIGMHHIHPCTIRANQHLRQHGHRHHEKRGAFYRLLKGKTHTGND